MAIDINCPFCQKTYKLKDDLAGKKVTCANQDCRKAFVVQPSTNGAAKPAAPKAPPKPAPPSPVDAEALAASALADDADAPKVPEDERTVEVRCTMCDHTWQVPWSMQGKNVLCPECRVRQKVPEQKKSAKADWRSGSGPVGRKIEELEGVQATEKAKMISGQTIREAGLVEVDYEPRPVTYWLKLAILPALLVVVIGGVVAWKMRSRQERKEEQFIQDFVKSADSEEMKNLPPEVSPLYRAAIFIQAGEYDARKGDQEHRDKAIAFFTNAKSELEKAKRSAERDVLFGELAVALLTLGGDEGQVKARTKLPWVPPPKNSRAKVKVSIAEEEGVQRQLSRVFEAMKQEKSPVEFEVRAATARRAARELIPKGQVQMLVDTLQAGFSESEQSEVKAQIGLELIRAGQKDKAKEVAESLKPTAPYSLALCMAFDPPVAGASAPNLPAGGEVSDATRLTYTALYLVQGKPTEALDVAAQKPAAPKIFEGKVRALALAAEWADQPGPFVEAAADIVTKQIPLKAEANLPSGQVLSRLGSAAGRAGMTDKVTTFTDPVAMIDEGLREWTKAEALRQRLRANPTLEAKDEDAGTLPDDARKYRLGHAWARLAIARHNAQRTNDRGLGAKYKLAWPTNTIAPFGQAGVALGVQDAELR